MVSAIICSTSTHQTIIHSSLGLFSVGERWLDERPYCEKVPRSNDYEIGATVVEKMMSAGIQSQDLNGMNFYDDLYTFFKP